MLSYSYYLKVLKKLRLVPFIKKLKAGKWFTFTGVAKLQETVTLAVLLLWELLLKFPMKLDQLSTSIKRQPYETPFVPLLKVPV